MLEWWRPRCSFQSSQYIEMLEASLQRGSGVPFHFTEPHVPCCCDPFRWWENSAIHLHLFETRTYIPVSLLNGAYKSQLLLLAHGLTRLLITSTDSYCSALDEYQLERWGNLRNGEERAAGDWLCCFGEGLPKKYYLGRLFFSPTLRGGWWDWQTNLQSMKCRPYRKHILLLISFVFLEGDGQIWLALSFRTMQHLSTLYNSVCLVSHGISRLKGVVGSCRQAYKERLWKQTNKQKSFATCKREFTREHLGE